MDRFDAGVILASFTFSIHPYVFYGVAAAFAVAVLYFFAIRPSMARAKIRWAEVAEREQWLCQAKKEQDSLEIKELLPGPWFEVYDVIGIGNYEARMRKLHELLNERSDLIPISPAACKKMAHRAAAASSASDEDFKLAMKWLAKFKKTEDNEKTGDKPNKKTGHLHRPLHRFANKYLAERLPKPWYDFALELINYPASRSLWFEKIRPNEQKQKPEHPCCKVPLTDAQAVIFAEAVAKDEVERGNYARDLVEFITLKSESGQPSLLPYPCSTCDHPRKLYDGGCQNCDSSDEPDYIAVQEDPKEEEPTCPDCGSDMILRRAKHGSHSGKQFYGCSKFPKCKGLINLASMEEEQWAYKETARC